MGWARPAILGCCVGSCLPPMWLSSPHVPSPCLSGPLPSLLSGKEDPFVTTGSRSWAPLVGTLADIRCRQSLWCCENQMTTQDQHSTCVAAGDLVRSCSEIPLPSPLFYSLSCLGPVAILDIRPAPRGRSVAIPRFVRKARAPPRATLEGTQSHQEAQDPDQLGSLAGAARLLHHNAGVLKHCSDGTEIPQGGEGQRCC